MINFLTENEHLQERVNAGVDVHPSEAVCTEFERLAKLISPKQDFSWRGCLDCVNRLIKFVFDNEAALAEKDGKVIRVAKTTTIKQDPA